MIESKERERESVCFLVAFSRRESCYISALVLVDKEAFFITTTHTFPKL